MAFRPPWLSIRRALRGSLPALVVGLPPLLWVLNGKDKASFTALGRDQGIFQYIAWAVAHGAKDYRDVRDVNGPLTHMVHMAFLALGGRDEHRFHQLDLAVTGATFAIAAACLPGVLRRGRVSALERAAWGLAGWVVLLGQYLLYLFWDIAQRESFCDWFLFPSLGLQLVAQAEMRRVRAQEAHGIGDARSRSGARPLWLLGAATALSVIAWFGKPTFALFTLVQLATLLIDRDRPPLRRCLAACTIGGLAGAALPLAYLVRYADIGAFLRISLHDVPVMYRFIWPRTFAEILALPGNAPTFGYALVTSAIVIGLILDGSMPRRALAIGLTPVCGILTLIIQGKGFPYHFHPITAGMNFQWLLLVAWLAERCRFAPRRDLSRLVPFAAAAVLALRITTTMSGSPHLQSLWVAEKGQTPEEREGHDFLVYFATSDFFPWEMRQAASYLREHTTPADRVQTYGMDPYVLFLAERASATPYIYAYDLNADAALAGGMLREGLHPNGLEQEKIRAVRDEHEEDFFARLQKGPPAAFVFIDRSPLITWQDAWVDLQAHVPRVATWVRQHYRQTAVFGAEHVWLRDDKAEGLAEAEPYPVDFADALRAAEASQ
ncbi:MAG TPA: hypothetical protein VGI39_42395 [Polyangiaceae bacterium]